MSHDTAAPAFVNGVLSIDPVSESMFWESFRVVDSLLKILAVLYSLKLSFNDSQLDTSAFLV